MKPQVCLLNRSMRVHVCTWHSRYERRGEQRIQWGADEACLQCLNLHGSRPHKLINAQIRMTEQKVSHTTKAHLVTL